MIFPSCSKSYIRGDLEAFMEFSSAEKIDEDLQSNMQFYNLRLRDPSLRESYVSFMEKSQSLSSYKAFNRLILLICVPFILMLLLRLRTSTSPEERIHLILIILALLIINISLWAIYFGLNVIACKYKQERVRKATPPDASKIVNDQHSSHKRTLKILYLCSIFAFHSVNCFRLIYKADAEQCSHGSRIYNWDCNPTKFHHTLPVDSTLIIMLLPIIYAVTMHGADFTFSLVIWFMSVVSLVVASVISHATQSAVMIAVFVAVTIVLIMEVHRQSYALFFTHRKLSEVLKERQQAADEENASEMRHMIANVAHDLKTPLASFVNGIDFINQVIDEMETKKASGGTVSTEEMEESVQCISQSISNMRTTNAFMLMTINRCIDYTKANNNMKLVPKYETIDLLDTLALPLNCMKDIQSRIDITLQPIDPAICMYIITDKQWLQENVLCLLSNAVKYSLDGMVTITVTKVRGQGKKDLSSKSSSSRSISSNKSGAKNVIYDMHRNKSYRKPYDLTHLESYRGNEKFSTKLESFEENDEEKEKEGKSTIGNSEGGLQNIPTLQEYVLENERKEREQEVATQTTTLKPFEKPASNPGISAGQVLPSSSSFDSIDNSDNSEDSNMIDYIQIEIEDHGIGLSDEAMHTLFSPFKQAQRLAGGTGLGLFSLAKRIEALEGLCGVKKRKDGKEGSLFWFSIPYRPDTILSSMLVSNGPSVTPPRGLSIPRLLTMKKASMQHLNSQPKLSSLSSDAKDKKKASKVPMSLNTASKEELLSKSNSVSNRSICSVAAKLDNLNVLIVDDSPTILKTTSMMLKRAKHNVTTAINGAEAVKMVTERMQSGSMFSVILMDLQMPVMDGLEATKRIRQVESNAKKLSASSSNRGLVTKTPSISTITNLFRTDSNRGCNGYHINIIGVSANSDAETSAAAYNVGVDAFIAKPFSLDAFNATYEQVIALQSTY